MRDRSDGFWIRTVGARTPDDPRNGELHWAVRLDESFHLEPWDSDPDAECEDDSDDLRYVLSGRPPEIDDQGRTVWIYEYAPDDRV